MGVGPVRFHRCPGCRIEAESFIGAPGGLFHCHVCRGNFRLSEFASVTRRRSIAVCNGCGRRVSASPGERRVARVHLR